MDKVVILLAVYNGEKFLKEQIDSILQQSYQNFHLIISDDASTDQSLRICQHYRDAYPEKISLLANKENRGVIGNFNLLSDYAYEPYVMLADQDDVWLPDKMADTLQAFKQAEEHFGSQTPLLVHSDARVVDENLKLLASSFCNSVPLNPKRTKLQQILMGSPGIGCTFMFNQALLQLAFPVPLVAPMHDYWLALVASAFGQIIAIPQALLLYRQHADNFMRAFRHRPFQGIIDALRQREIAIGQSRRMFSRLLAAYEFYNRYEAKLTPQQKKMLEVFFTMKNGSVWREITVRLRYGFLRWGIFINLHDFFLLWLVGPLDKRYYLHKK